MIGTVRAAVRDLGWIGQSSTSGAEVRTYETAVGASLRPRCCPDRRKTWRLEESRQEATADTADGSLRRDPC